MRAMAATNSTGFTMIEMILVVAILGILANLGIAVYRGHTGGAGRDLRPGIPAGIRAGNAAQVNDARLVAFGARATAQRYLPSHSPGGSVAERPSSLTFGRFSENVVSGVTTEYSM